MGYTAVFGGRSFEHEISIVSTITLAKKIDFTYFVFLDAAREFYLIEKEMMRSDTFSSGAYKKLPKLTPVQGGFLYKKFLGGKRIEAGTVINLVHGADGEDGVLASLFEFYGMEYIGPRVDASAISYDKELTKQLASARGVAALEYERIKDGPKELSCPLIIKPARLGSSIGISVVREEQELKYALDVAREYDERVIAEPFIEDIREFNLAGYYCKERGFVFSMVEEPIKKEILDFEKKYLDFSQNSSSQKADIPQALEERLKEAFVKIYTGLFEGALIRCDFFVIEDEVYLNEINPIPGSLANYLFEDFASCISELARSLPKKRRIEVDYSYINKIAKAKGKA